MHHIRNLFGYFIAGFCAMFLWGKVVEIINIGDLGNWIAAVVIIGPMWYINHYLGLIRHSDEMAFIDMAFGIGFAGIFKALFTGTGFDGLMESMPTFVLLVLGGSFGGYMATIVEKRWIKL